MTELISTASKVYAESLLKTGINSSDAIKDLNIIAKTVKKSDDLKNVVNNPAINTKLKFEILDEIFQNKINDKILSFMKILIERKRFSEFESIIEAYSMLVDEKNNVKRTKIVSAIELKENYKQDIINKLKAKLNKEIIPEWEVNKDIIGGLIIQIEDEIIDNSLSRRLEKISKM